MLAFFLLLQLACTFIMVGLIWFVQLVQYPLYSRVGAERFGEYQKHHVKWTTWIVGPAILGECVASVGLVCLRWEATAVGPDGRIAAWLGLALLAVALAATACWSVGAHRRLESGFDASTHRRLVATNWVRTAAWTGRGVIALWMAWRAMA